MDREFLTNDPGAARRSTGPVGCDGARPSIPDHELIRCIGGGSYGEVWLARTMMGLYRAVKFVSRKTFENPRHFERELSGLRKFEPISRSHEGFLDVLHVGLNEQEGYFYYVMELGDDIRSGQNIMPSTYAPKTLASEITTQGRLTYEQCLQIGLSLSQGIGELHRNGLVHRDVKPSNIIYVNGVAKLADIGLVASVSEARSFVGTEGFIPPEGPGSPQADVYGLGKVIYEACTGMDRLDFPSVPADWSQSPEHEALIELDQVLLQACDKNQAKRYQDGWEMHADLVVLASGKSVRRLKALERRLKQLKRLAVAAALLAILVAPFAYEYYLHGKAVEDTRQRQIGSALASGNAALDAGDYLGALPWYAELLQLGSSDAASQRENRLRFSSTFDQCPKLTQMLFAGGQAETVEFCPKGDRVLISTFTGAAREFDLASGLPRGSEFAKDDGLTSACYSPDGRLVLTSSEHGVAHLWNADSHEELLPSFDYGNRIFSACFSPDGNRIITSGADGIAQVWDLQTRKQKLRISHKGIRFAAFSNTNGEIIVTAGEDRTVRLWDSSSGQPIHDPLRHNRTVYFASFSPDNSLLVSASDDRTARIWDVKTGSRISPDLVHLNGARSPHFSSDGRLIITADLKGQARLWRTSDHQPLRPNPVLYQTDRTIFATFDPEGRRIATACLDGTVRIYDLAGSVIAPTPIRAIFSSDRTRFATITNKTITVFDTASREPVSPAISLPGESTDAVLSLDGRFIVLRSERDESSGTTGRIEVRRTESGAPVGAAIRSHAALADIALSKDGKRMIACTGSTARIFDVTTGAAIGRFLEPRHHITFASWHPDAQTVATCSGHSVNVWSAADGTERFPALDHPFDVNRVEFSSDGSKILTCGRDPLFTKCYAQVWNAQNGKPVGSQMFHGDGVIYATFSPDASRVASSGEDDLARTWLAATGQPLAPMELNHGNHVQSVAFSRDGAWVTTASSDSTARVWSALTGDPLTPPLLHKERLTSSIFLPDGTHLVTGDREGNFFLWELPAIVRPASELRRLARLMSAEKNNVAPNLPRKSKGTGSQEPLESLWADLKKGCPEQFMVSATQIAAWHQREADASLAEGNQEAARFHLKKLLEIKPSASADVERVTEGTDQHEKSH